LLRAPDLKQLASATLVTEQIHPNQLVRISSHNTGEPFFGRKGGNRFDDPMLGYGTCYLGFSLHCAFAETLLHDAEPDPKLNQGFSVPLADLRRQHVVELDGSPLEVVTFYGSSLRLLGPDGAISTVKPYDIPQAWSQGIHAHRQRVDGIRYVSRNMNSETAVVLFERAEPKLRLRNITAFGSYPGSGNVLMDFKVFPS
jgi:hypothetical protein